MPNNEDNESGAGDFPAYPGVHMHATIATTPTVHDLVEQWLARIDLDRIPNYRVFAALPAWSSLQSLNVDLTGQQVVELQIGQNCYRGHSHLDLLGRVVASTVLHLPNHDIVVNLVGLYTTHNTVPLTVIPEPNELVLPSVETDGFISAKDSWRVHVLHDPRDIPEQWVNNALSEAKLPVELTPVSNNEIGEAVAQIALFGIPLALLFNPFVAEIGKRAGSAWFDETVTNLRECYRRILDHSQTLERPTMIIATTFNGCVIKCAFARTISDRVKHDMCATLNSAVTEVASIIHTLRTRANMAPCEALYIYNIDEQRWMPEHIQLHDGRILKNETVTSLSTILTGDSSLGVQV